jgi:hypothetical protein
MEDGGTAAILYERIVRGVRRLHTPALSKRLEWLPWRLRTRKAWGWLPYKAARRRLARALKVKPEELA